MSTIDDKIAEDDFDEYARAYDNAYHRDYDKMYARAYVKTANKVIADRVARQICENAHMKYHEIALKKVQNLYEVYQPAQKCGVCGHWLFDEVVVVRGWMCHVNCVHAYSAASTSTPSSPSSAASSTASSAASSSSSSSTSSM